LRSSPLPSTAFSPKPANPVIPRNRFP
jgi:hypothetical protein